MSLVGLPKGVCSFALTQTAFISSVNFTASCHPPSSLGAVLLVLAGQALTCSVHLANTGNVGLQQVSLDPPTPACAIPDLQPGAAPHSCEVLFASSADDFEQGFMWRNASAQAHTKANVPVSGQNTQQVSLVASRRLSVALSTEPISVNQPGKMDHLKRS